MKRKGSLLLVALLALTVMLMALPQVMSASNSINDPVATLASSFQTTGQPGNSTNEFAPAFQTNDPFIDRQWALTQMPSVSISTGSETLVAILDTGIDVTHEDLADRVVDTVILSSSKTVEDLNGHGTHIAGIIAATRNNNIGIAGVVPKVKLLNIKVAEDNGTVWASKVAQGIIWATDKGAKVINMSLAVPSKLQQLEDAVHYAWQHGVVLVAAAGNHTTAAMYPAAYDNVIAVGAIDSAGDIWTESNKGAFVSAYAPGVSIVSTLPGNKYGYQSGSSMASAYVSAVAAELIDGAKDTNNDGKVNDEIADMVKTLFHKPTR